MTLIGLVFYRLQELFEFRVEDLFVELSLKVVYERIKGGVFLMSLFDEPSTLLLRRNTPWRKIT